LATAAPVNAGGVDVVDVVVVVVGLLGVVVGLDPPPGWLVVKV
jgi:hypothetical protein